MDANFGLQPIEGSKFGVIMLNPNFGKIVEVNRNNVRAGWVARNNTGNFSVIPAHLAKLFQNSVVAKTEEKKKMLEPTLPAGKIDWEGDVFCPNQHCAFWSADASEGDIIICDYCGLKFKATKLVI